MDLGLSHYLAVSAALFTIGVVGIFVNRKNIIVILMAIELILLSVNLNLIAFSVFSGTIAGQIFAMLVLTVAAAEADEPGIVAMTSMLTDPELKRSVRMQSGA